MIWPFPAFASAALALGVERLMGYPDALYKAIGHPVEWMGNLLKRFEDMFYSASAAPETQRLQGIITLVLLLLAVGIPAVLISNYLWQFSAGWVIEALLATSLIAQKSLGQHVADVAQALTQSIGAARTAIAKIVGRDPQHLDESAISRAALETLAENTSDGIVAPVLWYALLGLPGIAIYKAINTADSMIGHKSERYLYFGWAAARLDDLVNLPASRLTGLLFIAAARWQGHSHAALALSAMRRDARKHQSPNAGFPEAAFAGALDIQLGGPRSYEGHIVDLPTMGDGRRDLNREDILRGLELYNRALTLLFILALMCALLA